MEDKIVWRSVFIVLTLGILSLAISLSIFFYVRSREPVWDNRSRIYRVSAINSSVPNLGSEFYTMASGPTGKITLNGTDEVTDENSIYIRNSGAFIVKLRGTSYNSTTFVVEPFESSVLVNRLNGNSVIPLDANGSVVTPTSVSIAPITGITTALTVALVSDRLEITGTPSASTSYKFEVSVMGWY